MKEMRNRFEKIGNGIETLVLRSRKMGNRLPEHFLTIKR
jgi:hypothetical protein